MLLLPVWEAVARAKYIPETELESYDALLQEVSEAVASLHRPSASEETEMPAVMEA